MSDLNPTVECKIILLSEGVQEGELLARFILQNNSTKALRILKWGTPLEGLKTDCLKVISDGTRIPYDGRMRKRREPSDENYVTVEPQEVLESTINIAEGYKIPANSQVEISFDETKLIVENKTSDKTKENYFTETEDPDINVVNRPARFTSSTFPTFTAGEKHRSSKKKALITEVRSRKGLKSSIIVGGTVLRRKKTIAAHKAAYKLIKTALRHLNKKDDIEFITWFDAGNDSDRRNKVISTFTLMKNKMEAIVFTYDLRGTDCDEEEYGYTYKFDETIWLCKMVWTAPENGFCSLAGTIVHEISHAAAGTDDHRYGIEKCKRLAIKDPDRTVENADSYEFYAESLYVPQN